MLYGIEEYGYDEFGILKKQKLNIKKVIISIAVIIAAILIVVISFLTSLFFDEERSSENNYALAQENEITEESIERAKDTTERQMDRITNEKMMAINEYSDPVMTEIHKNHEEAVFLYDMLNNKHAQVKTTAAELNQTIKLSKQTQSVAKGKGQERKKEVEKKEDIPVVKPDFEPIVPEYINEADDKDFSEEPAVRTDEVAENAVPDTSDGADAFLIACVAISAITVLAIAAVAIVALVWYYSNQVSNSRRYDDGE